MKQVDLFVAALAGIIAIWSLFGAITLHPIFLRWKIAQRLHQRFSPIWVRFFFLAISLVMTVAAYRILNVAR